MLTNVPRTGDLESPRPHGSSLQKSARVYSATGPSQPYLPARIADLLGARVTEYYRQYFAVAVFVVAAFGMVGAMLGAARLLRLRRHLLNAPRV